MTLGQEFSGYAAQVEYGIRPLRELRVGIEPCADRRAALSEGENIGQRGLDAPDAVFDLRRVA